MPTDKFTAAVMKKVAVTAAKPMYQQPMVPQRLKKIFILAYCTLVGSILLLLLAITVIDLPIAGWLQSIDVPEIDYTKMLTFLFTFWLLFSINALYEKWFWSRGRAFNRLRR